MVLLYLGQVAPGRKKDPESRRYTDQSQVAVEAQKAKQLRGFPESHDSVCLQALLQQEGK